ncbi:HepT-like ribonuclease domain-containing protein [Spirosoma arcticum]
MSEEVRKWLSDIAGAIENIDIHLNGERDFVVYQANITIRRAVERELEIIGEAINRILKVDSTIAIFNARRIVDLRNRVIHAYDAVDDVIVWSVVIRSLPGLKLEIEQLLADA